MKTRSGETLRLIELLDEGKERALAAIAQRGAEWSDDVPPDPVMPPRLPRLAAARRLALRFALSFGVLAAASARAQVRPSDLEQREGLWYLRGSEAPYTGDVREEGRLEGRVEDGRRAGVWLWRFPSGTPSFQTTYDAEGRSARAEGWHANGRPAVAMTYREGQIDGEMRHWDEHGRLREERAYRAGRADGPHRIWDHTGALLYSATYRDDRLDGAATWWYSDGTKQWETHYAAGARTGTWSQWDEGGSLRMQTEWEAGTLVRRHNPHEGH